MIDNQGELETTSLLFDKTYNPNFVTLYGSTSDITSEYSTRFKFDGYHKEKVDSSIDILNDRFTKSLSVLPRDSEFRLEIITDEGSQVYDTTTEKFEIEGFDCMSWI